MDNHLWSEATWTELEKLGLGGRGAGQGNGVPRGPEVVALLPVGAVEAHGPHLPLTTDVIIATAAAEAALPDLRRLGFHPVILPPLAYTAAPFAAGFPGTISVRPATVSALLADVAASLERQGVAALVVVNAHLDPAHLGAIEEVVRTSGTAPRRDGALRVIHPELTRRRWASRLTPEFKSGACHAGCYETSVVMAAAPQLVRDDVRRGLAENPLSLSVAIRTGATTFEEAGVGEAYCGDPAAATRDEGEETVKVLGRILVDAVAEWLEEDRDADGAGRTEREETS